MVRLRYLSVPDLIASAGGNPWAINQSLQRGRPAQISLLAKAFHDAGELTAEAEAAFERARKRFEDAWNGENGEHPINCAAEVQRVTESLGVQTAQIPAIAVHLERVAAILAEAQRAAAVRMRVLEGHLEILDRRLGEAGDQLLPIGLDDITGHIEHQAMDETGAALRDVEHVRDRYADMLHQLIFHLQVKDGYDSRPVIALDGIDGESPEQAERDVHAALAGDAAAAGRVNAILSSITSEQRTGKESLTSEQASVVSQLQAQQHGMSISELWTAEQRLGDQRDMIANSWQLMSNPALTFPRTDLKPGAGQGSDMVNGGEVQLPQSVQQVLEAPWSQYCDLVIGPTLARTDPTRVIADIVRHGRSSFQTNTDLDRRMIAKASDMMNATFGDSASPAEVRLRETAFDPLIADLFAAAARDHPVIHDVLTGPEHEVFLRNITHHSWHDQGKGVAALFQWTEGAAYGPEARLAGEAAAAYGSYIGTNEHELLHLPGNRTVGQANPHLVQAIARGLTPYISNIAGTSGALPEFGFPADSYGEDGDSGKLPVAKGIFSVVSTDKAASDYFNGHADHQAVVAEGTYAQALAHHAPDLDSYNANLHDAMTLRGLVNSGIHNAAQADVENHQMTEEAAQRTEYDRKKTAYELEAKAVGAVAGLIPGVGSYAGPVVGILGQAIESDFVGPQPVGAPPPTDHVLTGMSIGHADREILNAVIASGQRVAGIPQQYLIDGRVGSPDELLSRGIHVESGTYHEALSRGLIDTLTQIYGNDAGRPVMPDMYMINRYNAVIHDQNPLKR